MAFWKRRRRAVRPYEPPSEFVPPPLEDLVEEGMLIALSGVRLGVKNRILVRVLRDGVALDLAWVCAVVGAELHALAQESADDADRLARQFAGKRPQPAAGVHGVDRVRWEPDRLPRREQLQRMLAARLQALSTDDEAVRGLAMASRDAALEDMVAARSSARHRHDASAERAREREAAIADLRGELEALAGAAR